MNNPTPTNDLLHRYLEWLENVKAKDIPLVAFDCPHCGTQLENIKPQSIVFTSLITCPYCDGLFKTETRPDGEVAIYYVRPGRPPHDP